MSDVTADGRSLHDAEFTARHFLIHTNTLDNWLSKGYVRAYRANGAGPLLYDLDEIETALVRIGRRKMRDGRRRGARGRVVAVVTAVGDGAS